MGIRSAFSPMGSGKKCPYEKEQTVFESNTPGTYNWELLQDCICRVVCVGAGGGAAGTRSSNSCAASSGASGSGFIGELKLVKGQYKLTVGAGGGAQCWLDGTCNGGVGGTSSVVLTEGNKTMVSSPGGGGGHTWWRSGAREAELGAMPTVNAEKANTPEINRQGNKGVNYNSGAGGASVVPNTTHGQGGHTDGWGGGINAYPGKPGIVKITFKRTK